MTVFSEHLRVFNKLNEEDTSQKSTLIMILCRESAISTVCLVGTVASCGKTRDATRRVEPRARL